MQWNGNVWKREECVDIEGGGREGEGCFVFGIMWDNTNACREDNECQKDVHPIISNETLMTILCAGVHQSMYHNNWEKQTQTQTK